MESDSTQKTTPDKTCEGTKYLKDDYFELKQDVSIRIKSESSTLDGKGQVEETPVFNQEHFNLCRHLANENIQIGFETLSISKGMTLECQPDFGTKNAAFQDVSLEDENEVREGSYENRLPDGGWGWVVLCGAALILMLIDILGQCFGVIFSSFLLELETPSIVTSWIFNLFGFVWCASGPFVGVLISEYGWRNLAITGSLLLFIATTSTAFIKEAWPLFVTYSLLSGIGGGILSTISYVAVPQYFNKRRGLANGILMAFDCSGQLFGPPVLEILQQEYTYKGATLILGGIILNCCVGAVVFHPVEWHLKKGVLQNKQNNLPTSLKAPGDNGKDDRDAKEKLFTVFSRLLRSIINDLKILKSARALTIAVSITLTMSSYLNFIAFVPFAMQENGYSLDEVVFCVSISALCNLTTRIVVATLSDYRWFDYRTIMIIACLLISSMMFGSVLFRNLTVLEVVMGLWGCGTGMFMSIFNLVMIHYMGIDKLTQTFGATMLCTAMGYLIIGPFIGLLSDLTHGYDASLCFLASMVSISFLLWISMPVAVAYDEGKLEEAT